MHAIYSIFITQQIGWILKLDSFLQDRFIRTILIFISLLHQVEDLFQMTYPSQLIVYLYWTLWILFLIICILSCVLGKYLHLHICIHITFTSDTNVIREYTSKFFKTNFVRMWFLTAATESFWISAKCSFISTYLFDAHISNKKWNCIF